MNTKRIGRKLRRGKLKVINLASSSEKLTGQARPTLVKATNNGVVANFWTGQIIEGMRYKALLNYPKINWQIISSKIKLLMTIELQIKELLPIQSGTSRSGNEWKKRDVIGQTDGQYPKDVCITLWGKTVDSFKSEPGDRVTFHVEVSSRKYYDRWYTEVKAWKFEAKGATNAPPTAPAPTEPYEQHGDFPEADVPFWYENYEHHTPNRPAPLFYGGAEVDQQALQ